MIKQGRDLSAQDGFALMYMAAALTLFCLATGLAVDSGRAYVVKAQLSKAVDGAALAAARNLNTGNPSGEAAKIFRANFPDGYFGTTSSTDPYTDTGFFSTYVIGATGVSVVTVTASAVLPTSFMKLGGFNQVTVTSTGEAQRRLVDLSLVLDVSGSIGAQWAAVRDASRAFVNSFDQTQDRLSLLFYGDSARVVDAMPSGRGFNKAGMMADIPTTLPGGSTAMVEGLYRGWDELRSVPLGSRSGLRVIVLFTDGASNSVPGDWEGTGFARGLRTYDFPHIASETAGQTHDDPYITGLYTTDPAYTPAQTLAVNAHIPLWSNTDTARTYGSTWPKYMVPQSLHTHHRSAGIPTWFPLQSNTLTVNGLTQSSTRGLRNKDIPANKFPAEVWNINNAARNLVEIIANAARDEVEPPGARVRIYTIGMGFLVTLPLGTRGETSESILRRVANDTVASGNVDFNSTQLQGNYYYAQTAADVSAAFQALQNQIVRLSK
jgi:Flp pilus assembly protein TadG